MTTRGLSTRAKGYIKSNYQRMSIPEMARNLYVTENEVRDWLSYNDLLDKKMLHKPRAIEREVAKKGFFSFEDYKNGI